MEINLTSLLISKIEKANYILISIPPINGEDIVLKNFEKKFKKTKKL